MGSGAEASREAVLWSGREPTISIGSSSATTVPAGRFQGPEDVLRTRTGRAVKRSEGRTERATCTLLCTEEVVVDQQSVSERSLGQRNTMEVSSIDSARG